MVDTEVFLPIQYKNLEFASAYRVDMLVENMIIVELKAVEQVLTLHHSQLLSYLRLSGLRLGILINFNVSILRQSVKRIVNNL